MTTESGKEPTLRQRIQDHDGQVYWHIRTPRAEYRILISKEAADTMVHDAERIGDAVVFALDTSPLGDPLLCLGFK